jgi:RNA polymerase sigma factor (sigma-70 family)
MMHTKQSKLSEFIKERRSALLHFIHSKASGVEAEDLLQDVLTGVISSDDSESIEEISGYLYRSIRNRIVDLFRKESRRSATAEIDYDNLSNALVDNSYEGIEEALERKDLREAIFAAVDELQPAERAVWIATELEGRSFAELSETWDEPIGTLLSRKSRANSKLRNKLVEYKPYVSTNNSMEELNEIS